MVRVRTQTGRSNVAGGARSASRTGQTQAREQNGSRHPPRPHSVAGGQSLPSNASRGEMLAVPQTPDVGTQSRTVGEIEHGGSRLSTRSRKPLPSFPESPRTEIYRESRADENLERNMDALKRCRHKLNVYRGGAKRFFMSWSNDRDSQLDRDELRAGFDSMELGFDDDQVNFLVRAFDIDKSNSVDFAEFCKTMDLTDNELVSTVCNESLNARPKWMLPDCWHYTTADHRKIDEMKREMQQRLHLTYGSDPTAMRRAFLLMDRQRCGMVTREDLIRSFSDLGMKVPARDVEMFLSAVADKREEGGIRYHSFLRFFEPGPVGSFNPFKPDEPIDGSRPGASKSAEEDVEGVRDYWHGSFGRDKRYRAIFPKLFGGAVRHSAIPPDFSGNRDTAHFYDWKEQGKIVGGNLNRMPAKRPLPTRGLGTSTQASPADSCQQSALLAAPERARAPQITMAHPRKNRETLLRERQERFQVRRAELLEAPSASPPGAGSSGVGLV